MSLISQNTPVIFVIIGGTLGWWWGVIYVEKIAPSIGRTGLNFEGAPITSSALLCGSAGLGYFMAEQSIFWFFISFILLTVIFLISTKRLWCAWLTESSLGAVGTAIFLAISLFFVHADIRLVHDG